MENIIFGMKYFLLWTGRIMRVVADSGSGMSGAVVKEVGYFCHGFFGWGSWGRSDGAKCEQFC